MKKEKQKITKEREVERMLKSKEKFLNKNNRNHTNRACRDNSSINYISNSKY